MTFILKKILIIVKFLWFYKQNTDTVYLWSRKISSSLSDFLFIAFFSQCLRWLNCKKINLTVFISQVEQSKVLIKEGGVQLLLTIVDTPGFGDAVDNSNW